MNLAENGTLTRYSVRSHSPRPTVVTHANGTRSFAGAAAANPISWVPVVKSTGVSLTKPRVARSWTGLNEVDNVQATGFSFEPPDQGLCVGAGHVLELINVTAQVFSTGGTAQTPAIDINKFFHVPPLFNPNTNKFGPELTDPSCTYDAGTGRFFATTLALELDPKTGNLTLINELLIAVSKTSSPLGGWNFYSIPATDIGGANGPAHKDCPCVGDYPHIGTDANGFYVTTNEYPWSSDPGVFGNNFNGAQIYALDKMGLVNGSSSINLVQFQNTHVTNASGVHPGFAVIPSLPVGASYPTVKHGSEYFTSSFAAEEAQPTNFTGHTNAVGLWQIGNTSSLATTPALTLFAFMLPSENYGVPPASNQKVGPTPLLDCLRVACRGDGGPYTSDVENGLDSSDSRILSSWYVGGHVFTALDTVMIVGTGVQAGVAWFNVKASLGASHVARQGYLGVANQNVIYPAIATTPAGFGVMGLTLSGTSYYPSAAYTFFGWRGPSGNVHTAALGKGPEDGFCEYDFFNCAGTNPPLARPRWGDYGASAWDGRHLWIANEFINQRCTFAQFNADTTCGGTRSYFGNFSTRITALTTH